ncbi:hypothetical protein BsWGS_19152 [Bradybaena similaris]
MSWIQATSLCAFTCFLGFIGRSGGLNCSQCNVRFMGVHNLCNKPRNATGCIGCMKTVAKVKVRDSGYIDGWERVSQVVSRFCITPGNINIKPAGCYKQQSNGGYTERCYCYTNNCNSRAPQMAWKSSFSTLGILTNMAVFLRML